MNMKNRPLGAKSINLNYINTFRAKGFMDSTSNTPSRRKKLCQFNSRHLRFILGMLFWDNQGIT